MQVRIMLQIVGDNGIIGSTEEVADLTKVTEGAEDLGLSLAESKALLGEHKELWGSDVSRDIELPLIRLAATF